MKKITRISYTASGLNMYIQNTKELLEDHGFKVVKVDIYNHPSKWWDWRDNDLLIADIYYEEQI